MEKNTSSSSNKTKQDKLKVESNVLEINKQHATPDSHETINRNTETQKQSLRILNLQKKVTRQVGNSRHDIPEDDFENI